MRKRTLVPTIIACTLAAGLGVALYLRALAPPDAARLLPESDAIIYLHVAPLRSATHFDQTPITRSADFQRFIDATGVDPERDIDAVAFALHEMPDPNGPNGPVAYSEVFVGRFDGDRLRHYLEGLAPAKEEYSGHTIYTIPIENRQLRITQLDFDTIAASNMPTAEQIHSMLDRSRASAIGLTGCSLLSKHYHDVPLLSQAWGIGHIGLPFSQDGQINAFGLTLPMAADTDLVASLRYTTSARLRIEEFAPDATSAAKTVEAVSSLLGIVRGISTQQQQHTPQDDALAKILDSVQVEQHQAHAIISASATADQLRALSAH
ncbi:hypothetical protein SAMN05421819_1618 [Bryocella elongata]|uniref:Uncharacterized protein n=1 Tax=Bryocella elongata TaxID=863522 RepID=A0A1H5WKQ2_9BACT|nr:hypothetical protein [Bryocella elongata]SEF99860.1 hypothetical protein SAMN05421819_1618 [Bryocella elongata]